MTRLNNTGIERYSPAERVLFRLLPKKGEPITSTALMEKFYKGRRLSVNARAAMNVTLKRLHDKVEHNREPFRVVRSRRKGIKTLDWCVRSH